MPDKSESGNGEISPQSLPGTNFPFLLFPDCERGSEKGRERSPLTSSWKGRNYAARTAAAAEVGIALYGTKCHRINRPAMRPLLPVNAFPEGQHILLPFDLRLTRPVKAFESTGYGKLEQHS